MYDIYESYYVLYIIIIMHIEARGQRSSFECERKRREDVYRGECCGAERECSRCELRGAGRTQQTNECT